MKYLTLIVITMTVVLACSNNKKMPEEHDKRISLHSDTLNVVKLSDTMVIYESTCRGCAMEGSTHFDISDTTGIIKLASIITTDNNPDGMSGGNVSKELILVATRTGTTTFKMYKFWEEQGTAKDSANAVSYSIEVKN